MKIVFLNGGLANQVFQYIFFRYAQIKRPDEEWMLDDSFFAVHNVHNGYELERVFGLQPAFLSKTFDPDVWGYMIQLKKEQNMSIPQLLLENGMDIKMVTDFNTWDQWNPFDGKKIDSPQGEFYPQIINLSGNIYYHGYWLNAGWFHAVENELKKELIFPKIEESNNREYLRMIHETESCSIHVRRGDFVQLGSSAPDSVYQEWIKEMLEYVPDISLFVFSDDLAYCKTHMHEMGFDLPKEVIFIEGNIKEKSFRDLQLMSQCKHMIYVNSSFSFLAALLNTNLQSYISPPNRRI